MNNIISELNEKQIRQLHELYLNEWWTKERTLKDTIKCVRGSQVCIGIVDENNNLIGFVRVITDFIFKALVFDLIINKNKRNQGIGKKLMKEMLHHKKLSEVKHFELYCLPELKSLYKQFGFSDDIKGVQLLRRKNA
ncbi:hypothetical protein MNBD_GAMMA11-584 [hydrothermal vent metagenome]|uniref:N-acetyltransferase domain-containing protein n=1 Tax=hydrothermal vent metagenome TaxID=652676 RepID=A0A3B0XRS1_9ZZZZ